jgi:hypothetical protein
VAACLRENFSIRLARVSPLQQAVVMAEALEEPEGLRTDEETITIGSIQHIKGDKHGIQKSIGNKPENFAALSGNTDVRRPDERDRQPENYGLRF